MIDAIAIGDVQGCLSCLRRLVEKIDAPQSQGAMPADLNHAPAAAPRLWFVGDLVNRGPQSADTLRWAMANEQRIVSVLGNHDLHLLAVAAGIRAAHASDTLDDVLNAPDAADLLDWVRRRPLAHLEQGHLMVHAGVFPQWSAQRTVALAAEVQEVLSGPRWIDFMRVMYGNEPARWSDSLTGGDRLRAIVNALTRMRFCALDGTMEFRAKGAPESAPPGHVPWFDLPERATQDVTMVFGHWSALGLVQRPNLVALDTGCIWGQSLTAVRLADRAVTQVSCGAGGS